MQTGIVPPGKGEREGAKRVLGRRLCEHREGVDRLISDVPDGDAHR